MRIALLTPRNRRFVFSSGFIQHAVVRDRLLPRGFCSGSTGEELRSSNSESKTEVHEYDVAIVGGGMVGMALACALSNVSLTKHLKVAIVDSNPALLMTNSFKRSSIPDSRVSSVTPATISFFKEIGAWEYVQQQRHAFFSKMQVWDYTGLGYTRYNAKDVGMENLGCVVENKVLLHSLLSCFQSNADLHKPIFPARLNAMSLQSHTPYKKSDLPGTEDNDARKKLHSGRLAKLDLSNDSSIYAKLVVGADGGKSHVREIAGLKTTGWHYSQNAIICTVEHDFENDCAWQRFLPSGPIALLPIGERFSNIVWTMSHDECLKRNSMRPDDFIKSVNHALDFGYGPHPHSSFVDKYIGKVSWFSGQSASSVKEEFQVPFKVTRLVSERMAFPLSLKHAHDYALKRVVLIGDAAHTVHPLAGQGVNLGFGDAFVLSKVIAEGISVGMDIGELSVLKKYERERKRANMTMMAIIDGFQKAFSVDLGPLNIIRAAGFHGAQYITPLKKNIISYATGSCVKDLRNGQWKEGARKVAVCLN